MTVVRERRSEEGVSPEEQGDGARGVKKEEQHLKQPLAGDQVETDLGVSFILVHCRSFYQ